MNRSQYLETLLETALGGQTVELGLASWREANALRYALYRAKTRVQGAEALRIVVKDKVLSISLDPLARAKVKIIPTPVA